MKFKITCSSETRSSVAKKFISSSLTIGLLLNTTLPSLASTLSEDGRYETFKDDNITIDNVLQEDVVDVEIEGNTMVNVANQEGSIPATKSYTVEGINHIPLQGDYNGKSRPVIEGNTMYYNNDTGELTDTFVEGANLSLVSSFEDQLVTENMVNSGQEEPENLGKYKVEYKVNGKNKICNGDSYENWKFNNSSGLKYEIIDNGFVLDNNIDSDGFSRISSNNIFLKANKTYTLSFDVEYLQDSEYNQIQSYISGANGESTHGKVIFENGRYIQTYTPQYDVTNISLYIRHRYAYDIVKANITNIQLEEGTTTTEYEPYKESIKTFYLNSPLLEGDTIEDIDGKATHVKRYDKVVLDGSEEWYTLSSNNIGINFAHSYKILPEDSKSYRNYISDKLDTSKSGIWADQHSFTKVNQLICHASRIYSKHLYVSTNLNTLNEFKQWLSESPITVVYELAEPIYETISQESILIDSYKDGHLDLNSNIPVNKVDFMPTTTNLNYLYPSTEYTVQFKSDTVGKIDTVSLGNEEVYNSYSVRKGVNRFNITTPSEISSTELILDGIGFNLSELVVTEATDDDFGYFEGTQSSFENQLVTQEMVNSGQEKDENLGKYKVSVKSTGKNIFDDEWEIGYFLESTGEPSTDFCDEDGYTGGYNPGYRRRTRNFIEVKPNTEYKLSNMESGRTFFYDKDMNYINNIINVQHTNIITPYNTRYIRFHYDWPNNENPPNIQLEEGSTSTEYEPHKESIKTFYLNSPLLEGDTIEYINGQPTHVKRYGKVVFDGNEKWSHELSDGTTSRFFGRLDGRPDINESIPIICDRFRFMIDGYTTDVESICTSWGGVYFRIDKSRLPEDSTNGFKQWLQANPTTVIYELYEPVYEPIKTDLSAQLFEGATHISNNSIIPASMKVTVDRAINRAVEAIELARTNPTMENVSIARMWANLIKESSKKDELQCTIDSFTEIKDLSIEKKTTSANADVYIKMKNSLSLSLDTNSIVFDDFDATEGVEMQNAVNLSVSSSLPYRVNAYLEDELYNADKSKKLDKSILNIKSNKSAEYRGFADIGTPITLLDDQNPDSDIVHGIDIRLDSTDTRKADVYKTTLKFEVVQK